MLDFHHRVVPTHGLEDLIVPKATRQTLQVDEIQSSLKIQGNYLF